MQTPTIHQYGGKISLYMKVSIKLSGPQHIYITFSKAQESVSLTQLKLNSTVFYWSQNPHSSLVRATECSGNI